MGQKLKDVLKGLKRQIIDVQVEVRFPRRIYKGKRSRVVKQFRVVGVYNTTTGTYHLYITNISPKRLSAKQIAHLPVRCTLACAQRASRQTGTYEARWLVELIFKQLKSYYQIDALPSSKQEIVEALLYTAILTMMISRTVQEVLELQANDEQTEDEAETYFPLLRTAAVISAWADKLLTAILKEVGLPKPAYSLSELIRKEAADPNRSRRLLLQRIQTI